MSEQRVLIVDDQEDLLRGLERLVEDMGHTVDVATTAEEALTLATSSIPDLVITDLNLPGMSGMELLERLQDAGCEATTIVLTGHGTIDTAVEATRRGVYDYLLKPVRPKDLTATVAKALERAALRNEVRLLRREMVRNGHLQGVVGKSPRMLEVYHLIEQVAPADAPVLLTGESGTGKEVVARTIHALSGRSEQRLIAVNCSAIPDELLESEMFGHEKGAFTGAISARRGCFELADGGTLFLDELGEMPVHLQSKLLRVLENGVFKRVGGEREITVDVRIIAATNADLEERLASGEFRRDLYFRLNVFHLHLPPLRDRPEDVPPLVEHFCSLIAEQEKMERVVFTDETMELLMAHDWPGNAREIRNVVHRAMVLGRGGEVMPHHLPPQIRPRSVRIPADSDQLEVNVGATIAEAERALILRTLESLGGNKTRAAQVLGISTKTLYTKLKKYAQEGAGGAG